MRTSREISKQERVHGPHKPKGNWMHLTIAPLVEEMLDGEQPLPGTASRGEELRPFVGTAGGTGLAHDDLAKPRK
jgi:hypothetical protein